MSSWKDAIRASPVRAANRALTDGRDYDGRQPNVLLFDGKLLKAFRAVEQYAWQRRSIGVAKLLTDWYPAPDMGCPTLPPCDQAETDMELPPYLFGRHDDDDASSL